MRLQLGLYTFSRSDSPSGSLQYLFACGLCHARLCHFFLDPGTCRLARFFFGFLLPHRTSMTNTLCAAVTQTLFAIPTINPCRKCRPGCARPIRNPVTKKVISQKRGSTFAGTIQTLAIAIASPNRDNLIINFQSISNFPLFAI